MLKRPLTNWNRHLHRNPNNFNRDVKVMFFNDNGKIYAFDPSRLERGQAYGQLPLTGIISNYQISKVTPTSNPGRSHQSILIENREFYDDVNVRGFEPFGL